MSRASIKKHELEKLNERPDDAELIIDGAQETAEEAALVIVRELERKGLLAAG